MNDVEIFAIDPGNVKSAYVILQVSKDYDLKNAKIVEFDKNDNEKVKEKLKAWVSKTCTGEEKTQYKLVIERIESFGMIVGNTVFETCEWIGRFTEAGDPIGAEYVYRHEEKVTLCNDSRANDTNVRHALIDMYAKFDFTRGKGTKNNPDTLYGFRADVWMALAVATTYMFQKKLLGYYEGRRKHD